MDPATGRARKTRADRRSPARERRTGSPVVPHAGMGRRRFSVTLRQASRRSWRIDQRQPVRVHFLIYPGTLQAKLLHLVATKLQASLVVNGELPQHGLAAEEAEDDVFLALARHAVAVRGTTAQGRVRP